jgi:hypothetical protein
VIPKRWTIFSLAFTSHEKRKKNSFLRMCWLAWHMIRTVSSSMYFACWFSSVTCKMSFFAIGNSGGMVSPPVVKQIHGPWICFMTTMFRKLAGWLFGYSAKFYGASRAADGEMFQNIVYDIQNIQKIHLVWLHTRPFRRLQDSWILYREDFNELDAFKALHFTATGALPAAKCTRILPMNQHADNIWNEGKFWPLFTDHRRCWKRYPFTRKCLSQLIVSLRNTRTTILALTAHQATTLTGWLQQFCYHSGTRLWHSNLSS